MKAFYTILILLLTTVLNVHSQSFSLNIPSGAIINVGDTIIVTGSDADQILEANIHLTNNASSAKTVKVKRTELSIVPGSANAFAFDQIEYPPFVDISQGNDLGAASQDSSFVAFYIPNGFTGVSFIQYTFFDENNPADSVSAIVEFQVSEVSGIPGINAISIFAFPNPVHSVLSISIPESNDDIVHVFIYNSMGDIVYSAFTKKTQLSIDVSALPPGYYTIEAGDAKWKVIKR